MQRELFGLVDTFVVLNETARRMLIADGAPGGQDRRQSPGHQPDGHRPQAGARSRADRAPGALRLPRTSRTRRRDCWSWRAPSRAIPTRRPVRAARSAVRSSMTPPVASSPSCRRRLATIRASIRAGRARARCSARARGARRPAVPVDLVRERPDDRARSDGRRHARDRRAAWETLPKSSMTASTDGWSRRAMSTRSGMCSSRSPPARARPSTSGGAHSPSPRTMDDIARDYLDLYVNRPTPCESRS